jgi:hypothetical protein
MADVIVSYEKEDRSRVETVVNVIKSAGPTCRVLFRRCQENGNALRASRRMHSACTICAA